MLAQGPASPTRAIPNREELGSVSVPLSEVIEEGEGIEGANQATVKENGNMPSSFRTADFSRGQEEQRGRAIDIRSPTES